MEKEKKKRITKKEIVKHIEKEKKQENNFENSIKKRIFINTIIGYIAFSIGLISLIFSFRAGLKETSYTIYIGATDKDAGYVVRTPREFTEGISHIFEEEKEGYILYTAESGNQNGEVYEHFPSYVIYTEVISKEKLNFIIKRISEELNDTAIFVQRSPKISHFTKFK